MDILRIYIYLATKDSWCKSRKTGIIGSNIFNILFVLGTAALVAPAGIHFAPGFLIDGLIAIGAVVMFMVFVGKNMKLKKYGAFIMLISYVCYLVYIL